MLLRASEPVPQEKGHATVTVRVAPSHVTGKVPYRTGEAAQVTRCRWLDCEEPYLHGRVLTSPERYALERTFLSDGSAIGVAGREHESSQFTRPRTCEDIAEALLIDIPDHEVTAAINNAAHDVAIRVHTHEFECVSAAKAPDFIHVLVCLPKKEVSATRHRLADSYIRTRRVRG
jgi:hypothetical protein